MNLESNHPNPPSVGQGVYYFDSGVCPGNLYVGLVKKVSRTSIVVLVPHFFFQVGGPGWNHLDPRNLLVFTWRQSKQKWARKGDGNAHGYILFPDSGSAVDIQNTFATLGE